MEAEGGLNFLATRSINLQNLGKCDSQVSFGSKKLGPSNLALRPKFVTQKFKSFGRVKICKCIQVSKVTFCSARFIYWFSEVLFGSARSYLAQRGYIQSNKVILSSARLY